MVTLEIAVADVQRLPEVNIIQELAPWYSYLAHEELIEFVGC
jgi:hypothetical protein